MSIFGYNQDFAMQTGRLINNYIRGCHFVVPSDVYQARSISVRIQTFYGTANVRCAIYTRSGLVWTKIANGETEQRNVALNQNYRWETFNFLSPYPTLTPGQDYYLFVWAEGTNYVFIRTDSANETDPYKSVEFVVTYASSYPSTLTAVTEGMQEMNNIYCTYDAQQTEPTVITNPATLVTQTSARLSGSIFTDGGATCNTIGFDMPIGTQLWSQSGTFPSGTPISLDVTGLSPNTTYQFRAWATNSVGRGDGSIQTFTTLSGEWYLKIQHGSGGSTNPTVEGMPTEGWHIPYNTYQNCRAYANTDWEFTGWTLDGNPAGMGDIADGYRISVGPFTDFSTHTLIANFSPISPTIVAPAVTASAASPIGMTTATLHGTVTDLGNDTAVVKVGFDIFDGTNWIPYESSVSVTSVPTDFSMPLTGLTENTTYQFRAKAQNSLYWGYSHTAPPYPSFTTTAPSVMFGKTDVGANEGSHGPLVSGEVALIGSKYYLAVPSAISNVRIYLRGFYATAPFDCRLAIYDETFHLLAVSNWQTFPSATVADWVDFAIVNGPAQLQIGNYWLCCMASNANLRYQYDDVSDTSALFVSRIPYTGEFPDLITTYLNYGARSMSIFAYGGLLQFPWNLNVTVYTDGVISNNGGSITCPDPLTIIPYNESRTLTANATVGYKFSSWVLVENGVPIDKGSSTSLTVGPYTDVTQELRANFTSMPSVSITTNLGSGPLYVQPNTSLNFTATVTKGTSPYMVTYYDAGDNPLGISNASPYSASILFPISTAIHAVVVDSKGDSSSSINAVVVNVSTTPPPDLLYVTVTASPKIVAPNNVVNVTVHVADKDGLAVGGASVTLSSSSATAIISPSSGATDSSGDFATLFTDSEPEQVNITAIVEKVNYASNSGSDAVTVQQGVVPPPNYRWLMVLGGLGIIGVLGLVLSGGGKERR